MTMYCLWDGRKSLVLEASPFSLFISNKYPHSVFVMKNGKSAYHVHTGNLYTKMSSPATNSSVAHEQRT